MRLCRLCDDQRAAADGFAGRRRRRRAWCFRPSGRGHSSVIDSPGASDRQRAATSSSFGASARTFASSTPPAASRPRSPRGRPSRRLAFHACSRSPASTSDLAPSGSTYLCIRLRRHILATRARSTGWKIFALPACDVAEHSAVDPEPGLGDEVQEVVRQVVVVARAVRPERRSLLSLDVDAVASPIRLDERDLHAAVCHTETCSVLSLVNGSRRQPPQRSRRVMPASCAIRSSSAGQT